MRHLHRCRRGGRGGQAQHQQALTTPRRAQGINAALADVIDSGSSVRELLHGSESFTYGTTRATNAIVEGKTARTAFFTTHGFPDILLLREGGKLDPFRRLPYPPPYVPRFLTFEIEAVDEGDVYIPLMRAFAPHSSAAKIWRCRRSESACSVSIVNPAHELRVGELIAESLPNVPSRSRISSTPSCASTGGPRRV